MKRLVALWIALALAACAIPEPPPGGPEDKTPPKVVGTIPAADSAGVALNSTIAIEFSEPMTRARVERLVTFYPPVSIGKVRWRGNALVLSPDGNLHPDTTYVVQIKPGYTDAHGVRSPETVRFAFATSARIDSGVVSGQAFFRRRPSTKAVVRLFRLPEDSSFVVEAARPDRETTVDKDGLFRFGHLPTRDARFLVWAFEDANTNQVFDRDREAGLERPDTVRLSAVSSQVTGQRLVIVDPKEPAQVSGTVQNETGNDSIPVMVTLTERGDSVPPTYAVKAAASGEFRFDRVLRGTYLVMAFLDIKPDSLCGRYPCREDTVAGCAEPCAADPDSLVIHPGDSVQLKKLVLGGKTPAGAKTP